MTTITTGQKVRQPAGFYILFLTEMWERFGFYLISSLLVLYLTKTMGFDDTTAYTAFASFVALLYITPAVGGYVADKFLGYRRSLGIGAAFLTVGYAILAMPEKSFMWPALACIIIGMGFFKSMPYALLNKLYQSDAQRAKMDGAFTLYYLSIQVGGLVPVFAGGFLANAMGYHATFAIGMVGMFIGFMTFIFGIRCFKNADIEIGYEKTNYFFIAMVIIACIFVIAFITRMLEHSQATHMLVWSVAVVMLAYVIFKGKSLATIDRVKLAVAVGLTVMGIVFFALYYQQPMSLTLFIDRNVDRHMFGFTMPSSSYWVWNPIWILIIGPCLTAIYNYFGRRQRDLSITMKFGVGIIFMGLGYFVVTVGTWFADSTQHISSGWIIGSYALQSTAELMVNALGTAMIAKLAHKSVMNVMMGIWFIGTSIGGLLAGNFADMTAVPDKATAIDSLHIYAHAFNIFAIVSVVIGVIVCIAAPMVTRMVQEKHDAPSVANAAIPIGA